MNSRNIFSLRLSMLAGLLMTFAMLNAQSLAPDTLFCGDTLIAEFTPGQIGPATDTFYVWLGNCDSLVRFDFTTANVPDAADIYYVDLDGNLSNAGKIPYFGAACGANNYFGDPGLYPLSMSNDPQYCLPGFMELYGGGIPFQDSIVQRFALPGDFMLSGYYQESARLHLKIPAGIVAVQFIVKYNPGQQTVLSALWDCSPTCCIAAKGDTVCVGENIELGTDREALSYNWTGPNGFSSTDRSPIIPQAGQQAEGWYVVEGMYRFGCAGVDSVYVEVNGPEVSFATDTTEICLGSTTSLQANGAQAYQWDTSISGFQAANGNLATVGPFVPATYRVIGTDEHGCSDTAFATVIPLDLDVAVEVSDPSCVGSTDGTITGEILGGIAPFQIRLEGGDWQPGTMLSELGAGAYTIEVQDQMGCLANGTALLSDPEPLLLATSVTDPSCAGACDGEAFLVPSGGTGIWRYQMNGVEIDSVIGDLCAGSYEAEVVDENGCTEIVPFQLRDPAPFTIDLGKDKKIREGDSIQLVIMTESILDIVSWPGYCEWDCGNTLLVGPDSLETITAVAWTPEGCMAVDSVRVRVRKKAKCIEGVYAPTAFSPNGDGHNEMFTIYGDPIDTDIARVGRLLIYNRWGRPVFERNGFALNDESQGWNGFSKGVSQPEGVYTWAGTFIRQDGLTFTCGGSVTLIR